MQSKIIPVVEASQISEVRRAGLRIAEDLNWDETSAGKLGIVLTEIGTNLVKHAKGGEIHLRTFAREGQTTVEVLAFDRGPGVDRIDACLQNGYSTAGTAGTGLGAIRRLADEFDIYSQEGRGTCMVARLHNPKDTPSYPSSELLHIGAVQMPMRGETECGDSWGVRTEQGRTVVLVADGLGHGPGAAEASREAVAVLARTNDLAPASVLEAVHYALRPTRGAAVAVAHVEPRDGQVRFAGAGNISAMVISPSRQQHMISHNGTAGHNVRKFQEFVYPWSRASVLVMHSDGITTSWRLDTYPGVIERDPSLLAAVLLRDAARGRDDATVLVGRNAN